MGEKSYKNRSFLICLILISANLAVYYQMFNFNFVNIDDPGYVSDNPNIQAGITLKAIKWAFTTGYANFWHPVTWLSLMLDWQLFGSNAAGFHLTNLIFHIANTLLLFIVFKRMTNALWQSAFVAALFALHPLHVESVAWISERKDVLSTFFWLLTMAAYLRYVKQPNIARYLLILLTFTLGLMSKPMLVTLPFVLLLLDYWPLERFPSGQAVGKTNRRNKRHSDTRFQWQILFSLILEKIPFIVLSGVSSVIAFLVQRSGGAVPSFTALSLKLRIYNAFISYVKYIEKMFWPVGLTFFYPHPGQNVSIFYALISAFLLLIITILIFRLARNHRYFVTGWLWYLITLLPVIGLIQVGRHSMADRYAYITLIGLFIMISWSLPELLGRWEYGKIVLWISAMMVLSALTLCSYFQTLYWKDTITLCQHALQVTENNYLAHFSMTQPLIDQGRIEEAIWHNSQAVRIKPDYAEALNGLGAALEHSGRVEDAIGYYEKALEIDSHLTRAHLNLAVVYMKKGDFVRAAAHYKISMTDSSIKFPDDPNILNNIGYTFANAGEFDEAVSLYNKALRIAPESINIHLNLGFALTCIGKLEEAKKEYEKILLLQPGNAVAHNDFGVVFFRQSKLDKAIAHFSQALRINPDYIDAKNNLNAALAEKQKSNDNVPESYRK